MAIQRSRFTNAENSGNNDVDLSNFSAIPLKHFLSLFNGLDTLGIAGNPFQLYETIRDILEDKESKPKLEDAFKTLSSKKKIY